MTKPELSEFSPITSLLIQQYERYLPTAFDESMSILQKLNKIIQKLDEIGLLSNEVVTKWNEVMVWVMGEGLNESVIAKINEMVTDGVFATIINEEIFGLLNDEIDNLDTKVDDVTKSHSLNVKYPFGTGLTALKGDGTDETTNFIAILNYAKTRLPMKLYFPNGTYGIGYVENLAYKGLTYEGANDRGVVFKSTRTEQNHIAFNFDAFYTGIVATGFVNRCNVKNVIFEGNSETNTIVNVQGIARSSWKNVYARIGKVGTDILKTYFFKFNGVMLSNFENIMASTQMDSMGANIPYYGIFFDSGFRGTGSDREDVGHCSNNVFTSCYFEGMSEGMRLAKADQNTFIGGSPESCTVNGLYIYPESMYNTFIGTGFENKDAVTDVDDSGLSTQFINCYSSKYMKVRGQNARVVGGLYANLELMPTSNNCTVENVKVKHFGGSVGFVDGGTGNKWRSVFDEVLNAFRYASKPRTSISVGASPFGWTNNTGNLVEVFITGGDITRIDKTRNSGDPYQVSYTAPASYFVSPNDGITITHTTTPSMSYREANGF